MTNEQSEFQQPDGGVSADRDGIDEGRRRALRTGAILVPTIVTLHATPAFAQTDYTMVAYRYGVNSGLCRNPHFNPSANPNSTAGQEFIECPDSRRGGGRRHSIIDGDPGATEGDGLREIEIK